MNNIEFKNYFRQIRFRRIIDDKKLKKELCSVKYKKYKKWIIDKANIFIKDKIIIFNNKWDFQKIDKVVDYNEGIDWHHTPNGDDEFIYMKNRHRSWLIMAQAYYFTQDEKYVIAWKKQFKEWIKQDYPNTGLESKIIRLIDKSIRMENWIQLILLINNSPNFDYKIFNIMFAQVKNHAIELINEYPVQEILSNHGLVQNKGLLKVQYYFGDILKIKYKKIIKKRIEDNARLQILPDGIQWEQSPMYHTYTLYTFLEINKYFRLLKMSLSSDYYKSVKNLALGVVKFIKPNGNQPMQNDSDDTNVQDILTRAALELNDGVLKTLALKHLDFDTAFDYGSIGIEKYNKIKTKKIPFTSVSCDQSGNYYLRSLWEKDANYLSFRNGQYGSGHSHCDPNHFTIFANGIDWISNTGRYTYKESQERLMFKSAQYHNTQIINDLGATRAKGSWTFHSIARVIKRQSFIGEDIDYVSGANLGFLYDKNAVVPLREIIFIKPGYWFILDTFYSKYKNNYQLNFHIDKSIKININDQINLINLSKENKQFRIFNLSSTKIKIKKGKISKRYNEIEDSNIIQENITLTGISNIANVFDADGTIEKIEKILIRKPNNLICTDEEANAWEIVRKNNEKEILFFANTENHQGKKIYILNGINFYGKKAVLKFKNNKFIKIDILEF